jgi:Flp pilus assembly protein TadG
MRRAFIGLVLFALALGAMTAEWSSMAAAASGVSCTKLSANYDKAGNGTVSGCSDAANTGGMGTFPNSSAAGEEGTITWADGKGSTTIEANSSTVTTNNCPSPSTQTEFEVTGAVTGGTGAARRSIKKGWTLQEFVCLKGSGKITLAPGTTFDIGPDA